MVYRRLRRRRFASGGLDWPALLPAVFGSSGGPGLLRDTFATARTAGGVNGTAAEPGPDKRYVVDPDSLMSISAAGLNVVGLSGVAADFRPGLAYRPVQRNNGSKILVATVTPKVLRGPDKIGFYSRLAANGDTFGLRFVGGLYGTVNNANTGSLGAYSNGTTYQVGIILHPNGGEIWIKGGAWASWTRLHQDATAATSIVVYPVISFYSYWNIEATVSFVQLANYKGGSPADYFGNLGRPRRRADNVLMIGDSKMLAVNGAWKLPEHASTDRRAFLERPGRIATAGWKTADAKAAIDAALAAAVGTPAFCWINLGANDVTGMPAEATWKANMLYIIDAVGTKWPGCVCVLARVWRRGYAANCNTLAGWISDVVAARPGLARPGPDERVFLENGDDGATYTTDGTHYTTAAYDLAAPLWRAAT